MLLQEAKASFISLLPFTIAISLVVSVQVASFPCPSQQHENSRVPWH